MARKLDEQQQAELTDFVNALADMAGYTTTADWVRESGYYAPNLSELRSGTAAIDGYNLLRLIRAAALRAKLTSEQLALATERVRAEGASEESTARRLDELAALVAEALAELRERTSQPEVQQRAPAKPRSRAKKAARG